MIRVPIILAATGLLVISACAGLDTPDNDGRQTTRPAPTLATPAPSPPDASAAVERLCDTGQPASLLAMAERVDELDTSVEDTTELSVQARALEEDLAQVPLGPDALGLRDSAVGAIAMIESEASDQAQRQRAAAVASEALRALSTQLCPPPLI